MALTANERQARYRASCEARGWAGLWVIVPARTAHELQLVAQALRARDDLEVGPLRDLKSGRLISAKAVLRDAGARTGAQIPIAVAASPFLPRDGDDGGSL